KITDAQIQAELSKLIDGGKAPAPDANSLYMVHFPPGITIDDGQGGTSCNEFCAYHGSYKKAGKSIYYGVIPDQGGPCAMGSAGGSASFTITTTGIAGAPEMLGFSVAGVPPGASASFDKTSATTGGTVILTVNTSASAAPGSSTLTITGAGVTSQVATVTLTVT